MESLFLFLFFFFFSNVFPVSIILIISGLLGSDFLWNFAVSIPPGSKRFFYRSMINVQSICRAMKIPAY